VSTVRTQQSEEAMGNVSMEPSAVSRPELEPDIPFEDPRNRSLFGAQSGTLERMVLRKLDEFYAVVPEGNTETHFIDRVLGTLNVRCEIREDDCVARRFPQQVL
jgi:hypothetical protein